MVGSVEADDHEQVRVLEVVLLLIDVALDVKLDYGRWIDGLTGFLFTLRHNQSLFRLLQQGDGVVR